MSTSFWSRSWGKKTEGKVIVKGCKAMWCCWKMVSDSAMSSSIKMVDWSNGMLVDPIGRSKEGYKFAIEMLEVDMQIISRILEGGLVARRGVTTRAAKLLLFVTCLIPLCKLEYEYCGI